MPASPRHLDGTALDEQAQRRQGIDALLSQTYGRYRTALPDTQRAEILDALQSYAPADVAWAIHRYQSGIGLQGFRRGPPDAPALRAILDPELRRRAKAHHLASLIVAEAFCFEPARRTQAEAQVGPDGCSVVASLGGWATLHDYVQSYGVCSMVHEAFEAVQARLAVIEHRKTIARLRKMTAAVQHG